MKTIRNLLTMTAVLITGMIAAQTSGTIKGTVLDEKNEALAFVPVAIMIDSTVAYQAQTNMDGEFIIKDATPGKYNVKTVYTGYATSLIRGVTVVPNDIRYLEIHMKMTAIELEGAIVEETYTAPIIDTRYTTVKSISIDQIENAATGKSDVIGLITMVASDALPTEDGKDVYLRGTRRGSTAYYIDGNRPLNIPDVPGMAVGGMEVLSGGLPAEYGDCTGGIVLITTKDYKVEMLRKDNAREEAREKKKKEKREKEKKERKTQEEK